MNKILAFFFLLSIPLFLCSCAKQGFPPGGPVDKTPPEVVSTSPLCNFTGVSPETQIEVTFSKRMERESVQKAVYISPVLERPPELSWKGRTLFIKSLQRFSTDRTYVVTIGTGAQDQQGNPLAKPYSFAFSTGSRMDLGEISGKVTTPAGPQARAFVWAYRLEPGKEPDPGKGNPDYITETDGEGDYFLRFLSPGVYRVFAFLDKDGDRKYAPEQEPLAVPPTDATLSDSADSVPMTDLFPVVRDTTRPQLPAVEIPDQIHLEVPPSDSLSNSWLTTARKDSLGFVAGEVDAEVLDPEAEIYLRFHKTDGAAEYRFKAPREGKYLTGGVLPGTYFIWTFWDKNGNGKQDYGRPWPYQPAEPVISFPGTVGVRSRWTTEKVDLKF